MLVPRSFKYSSSPPTDAQKQRRPSTPKSKKTFAPAFIDPPPPRSDASSTSLSSHPPPHAPWILTPAMPATLQPSRPVEIPTPTRRSPREHKPARTSRASSNSSRRSRDSEKKHRPDALPPAVAALLAVTAIPPPKSQLRRKKSPVRDMSIDELIQEWRKDTSTKSSYSCASLDMLLGSADEDDYEHMYSSRSTSCDSIPSLDADEASSVLSLSNPATPDSIRSRKSSMGSYRKEKTFCTPEIEDCSVDHPLGFSTIEFDEDLILINSPCPKERKQRKSGGFRSNLSSSLQAIKSRVTSSFSSLNLNLDEDSFSDASLWQHPYLFPRLSSELRPTPFASTPSKSHRQYLNPRSAPVPFEEQQHHWQKALSSDSSESECPETPMIQMQTYNKRAASSPRRSRRGSSTGAPDPRSEAGRAMSGHVPMPTRQREPRENSDFLRVIVLEMNMRRGGKFEEGASGRARIWLPPRKQPAARNSVFDDDDEDEITSVGGPRVAARKIPRRWVPVSIE
ncbi:hypothetical protein D6C91_05149 [Aureobasidium pullulans]|uniref:Uncharacterized protein n=1 Tax=Aureobasidium pullulans TaxID=5580 RepID=A0A4S9T4T6_AURPU|nr:hypothetical protein D6C91_05149 [Aureobasidium pullulans]